ncbi:tetratricopeptide repeat protein [Scopulibacillus cellulosilyticus]|uniref:Tetratricopeptide repeat protein n=1 Tax=Scopulibacillus cellulosilyticus TaxID=2665665 RepID=A0ABW2PQG5_9BACL
MVLKTVENKYMMQLLNDWYKEMQFNHFSKAKEIREIVSDNINNLEEEDQTLLIYFSLLDYRYQLFIDNFGKADQTLDQIKPIMEQTDDLLAYYYYFFQAIHATKTGNYSNARKYFIEAEKLLKNVPDVIEKAEFNYKVAIFYYHIHQNLLAMNYALKAKAIFEESFGYEINAADCENILGLACTDLKQFENAEKYFNHALKTAEKQNHQKLYILICYNLGLLYAEQNGLSDDAIRYLNYAYENKFKLYKTTFLLAREYYKLGESDKGYIFLREGMKHCKQSNNKEYEHHLNILDKLNNSSDEKELESAVKEGLIYFQSEGLWGFIRDYAEQLAVYFHKKNDFVKASYYFNLSYEAKQNLYEKGALK